MAELLPSKQVVAGSIPVSRSSAHQTLQRMQSECRRKAAFCFSGRLGWQVAIGLAYKKTALSLAERRRLTRYEAEITIQFVVSGPHLGVNKLKWGIPARSAALAAIQLGFEALAP